MIPAPDVLRRVIDALNELGTDYMVTDSVASNAYGEPRATIDADIVLCADESTITNLRQLLNEEFEIEPQLAFEAVTGKTQHLFRHRQTKFLVEFFELSKDVFDQSRFARKRSVRFLDRTVPFPTAEDVIVQKLLWYKRLRRTKDHDDLVGVIRRQRDQLDMQYILTWCDYHETRDWLAHFLDSDKPVSDAGPVSD